MRFTGLLRQIYGSPLFIRFRKGREKRKETMKSEADRLRDPLSIFTIACIEERKRRARSIKVISTHGKHVKKRRKKEQKRAL